MKCPHCGKRINVGKLIGSVTTPAKAKSSRANGKLGGRPRKRDATSAQIYDTADAIAMSLKTRRITPEQIVNVAHQCLGMHVSKRAPVQSDEKQPIESFVKLLRDRGDKDKDILTIITRAAFSPKRRAQRRLAAFMLNQAEANAAARAAANAA